MFNRSKRVMRELIRICLVTICLSGCDQLLEFSRAVLAQDNMDKGCPECHACETGRQICCDDGRLPCCDDGRLRNCLQRCKHGAHKAKEKRTTELPPEDLPDFPRFFAVPIQPVFSPRDMRGFPNYGPTPVADAWTPEAEPLLDRDEVVFPAVPSKTPRPAPRSKRPAYTASWVFTPAIRPAEVVVPARPPRPQFDVNRPNRTVERPSATTAR